MPGPDTLPAWRALRKYRQGAPGGEPREQRPLHFTAAGIHADLSHALPGSQCLELLLQLAQETGVARKIEALFAGAPVNVSEGRQVLHPLLRTAPGAAPPGLRATQRQLRATQRQAEALVTQLRSGRRRGFSGAPFRDVVHVGIGGSLLGPRLLTQALAARQGGLRCHFLGGIDGEEWDAVMHTLAAQNTLFILASKSGATREVLQNIRAARKWLRGAAGREASIDGHFVAVTANPETVHGLGVPQEAILPFPGSIGGRYSLWSAMALPLALRDGNARWRALLRGAAQMDAHFRSTAPAQNLPLLLGLLDVWHASFCGHRARAVVPYAYRLRGLPEFLQQLLMESNGKSVQNSGEPVQYATAPVLWGGPGPESQHSFHQLLYQGTPEAAVEFVLVRRGRERRKEPRNRELWAHCLAQVQALSGGRSPGEASAALVRRGWTPADAQTLAPHLSIPGGRPVSLLALDTLDARGLGALLALWEHRVYTAAAVWDINCFDQWGVELGKTIGTEVRAVLAGKEAEVSPTVRRWASWYRD